MSNEPPFSFLHFMENEEALTTPFGLTGGFLPSCVTTVWAVPLGKDEGVPLTGRAPNFGNLDTMGDLLRTFCSISIWQSHGCTLKTHLFDENQPRLSMMSMNVKAQEFTFNFNSYFNSSWLE